VAVVVRELAEGDDLTAALAGLDPGALVAVVPPGTALVAPERVVEAFERLEATVVLAASPIPTGTSAGVDAPTPYRCVAPAAIGPVEAVRALGVFTASALTDAYLGGADLELDLGAEIFLVRDGTGTDAITLDGEWFATATGTWPVFLIGDGQAALPMDDRLRGSAVARVLAPEVLAMPFWTPEKCAAVVAAAERAQAWGSDPDDPVPGYEVSLATVDPVLFAGVEKQCADLVVPVLRAHWPQIAWNGLQDAFVIKYVATEGVNELPLHHDVAQISGSVRLNTGYVGGALSFPRQGWDNGGVAVGDIVLWPSLVTHPHCGAPVERGVKYGLTIWFRLP
jgi:hypothetical protein